VVAASFWRVFIRKGEAWRTITKKCLIINVTVRMGNVVLLPYKSVTTPLIRK